MAIRRSGIKWIFDSPKKKTKQGSGKFTKAPSAGGESFLQGHRAGIATVKSQKKEEVLPRSGSITFKNASKVCDKLHDRRASRNFSCYPSYPGWTAHYMGYT